MSDSGTGAGQRDVEAEMADQKNGMDAATPQDGALDGDQNSGAVHAGQAPGGTEAMPDDTSRPSMDGGVMGAEPLNASVGTPGNTGVNDKGEPYPPEEMNH